MHISIDNYRPDKSDLTTDISPAIQAKKVTMSTSSSLDTELMAVEERLAQSLMEHLDFGPSGGEYVYNPIDHARDLHADFLAKYYSGGGESPRPIMFLGMNPGPWGMSQTGKAFFPC